MPEPLVVLTSDLRITAANEAFARCLHLTRELMLQRPLFEFMRETQGSVAFRKSLVGIIPTNTGLTKHEVRLELLTSRPCRFVVDASRIVSGTRVYPMLLLSVRAAE